MTYSSFTMKRQRTIEEYFTHTSSGKPVSKVVPKACIYSDVYDYSCLAMVVFCIPEICANIYMSFHFNTSDKEMRKMFYLCKAIYQKIPVVTKLIERNMHDKYEKWGGREMYSVMDPSIHRYHLGEYDKAGDRRPIEYFSYTNSELTKAMAEVLYLSKFTVWNHDKELIWREDMWERILITGTEVSLKLFEMDKAEQGLQFRNYTKPHKKKFVKYFCQIRKALFQSSWIKVHMQNLRRSLEIDHNVDSDLQ